MKNKKRMINKNIFLIIFILINMIFASNYLISHSLYPKEDNLFDDFSNKIFKSIAEFFSIKEIGIVSAEIFCCELGENDETCLELEGSLSEANSFCKRDFKIGSCEDYDECKLGCCVYNQGESCSPRSAKWQCEENGGVFNKNDIDCDEGICQRGCCELMSFNLFITEKECEIEAENQGLPKDFISGLNEAECLDKRDYEINTGACVIINTEGEDNCKITTENHCDTYRGNFYLGELCTNPNLDTECEKTENTVCYNEKVYFMDSCNNTANIYDSSKINDEDYWDKIYPFYQSCNSESGNLNSIACGNCNRNLGSVCASSIGTDVNPDYGENYCKSLNCENAPARINNLGEVLETKYRGNGESWCLYDASIGVEKSPFGSDIATDPPGSLHWLATCVNGKIEMGHCDDSRNGICVETQIYEPNLEKNLSIGICATKQASQCLNYNKAKTNKKYDESKMIQKCNENDLCYVHQVKVTSNFKFKVCLAKNPPGFDLKDPIEKSIAGKTCKLATITCNVQHNDGGLFGDEEWVNEKCLKKEFVEEMNDFCISLGDCGSYVNYIGVGTENIKVKKNNKKIKVSKYFKYNETLNKTMTSLVLDEIAKEITSKLLKKVGEKIDYRKGGSASVIHKAGIFSQSREAPLINSMPTRPIRVTIRMGETLAKLGVFLFPEVPTKIISGVIDDIFGSDIGGFFFGDTETTEVKFYCYPWQPPKGGEYCELCNDDPLGRPCTEYKCHSLGKACELVNADTDYPTCELVEDDGNMPIISATKNISEGYKFKDEGGLSVDIIPIENIDDKKCIEIFEQVDFVLETDKQSQCKYFFGTPSETSFEDMWEEFHEEGSFFTKNHTFKIITSEIHFNNFEKQRDEELRRDYYHQTMYVKCQDYWGVPNMLPYKINFCIYEDDRTPVNFNRVEIEPASNSYLPFETTNQETFFYLPEPAQCKYSENSKEYIEMENEMDCEKFDSENMFKDSWICFTNFTNLSEGENKFYIRCNDSVGNINQGDFEYKLHVSEEELKIDSIEFKVNFEGRSHSPNEEGELVLGGTASSGVNLEVIVKTSGGADDGKTSCILTQDNWPYFEIGESNTTIKKQILSGKIEGEFEIYIECEDIGKNIANKSKIFKLSLDNTFPKITRFYREGGFLEILTDEKAKCYLNLIKDKSCNFNIENEEEYNLVNSGGFGEKSSFVWESNLNYYIKCKDVWGNVPDSCSIIIKSNNF